MILIGEKKESKLSKLFEVLKGKSSLLVLTHTNPDPDGMGAGVGLCYLVKEKLGIHCDFAYQGDIFRAENKAMVRVLSLDLKPFEKINIKNFDAFALVDSQPGFGHTIINKNIFPNIVIDHHVSPSAGISIEVQFVDVRTNVGATSSIVTEYIMEADIPLPKGIATALFYGLSTDTAQLSRNVSELDEKVYLYLLPKVDRKALHEISSPKVPVTYFRALDKALDTAEIYGNVIFSTLRQTDNPEMVAEIADFLLRLDGITWAICGGLFESKYYISVRAEEGQGKDAWLLLKDVLKEEGIFGGHGTVAGGRIPLVDTSSRSLKKLENRLKKAFLDALGERGRTPVKLIFKEK